MYQQTFSPPPMPGMASPPGNYRSPNMGRSPMSPGGPMGYPNAQMPVQAYGMPGGNGHSPNPPLPVPPQARHKGTLAPGTLIEVGDVSVRIEKYLSEGGYAHVYLSSSDAPIYPPRKGEQKGRWGEKGYTQHCLKRIAFDDEKVWVDVRKEIEVMKALPPNPHLTQYLASAHARLPSGGYEVYILMEFCPGGGIIDLLNKRLRDRLKEIEILNIFTDVCEAVAAMHALKQPLLHRDLKIENVLSAPSASPPTAQRPTTLTFKLCDFGSTTFPASQPPANKIEADSLAMDLNKHTTLQYRSPEMVEPMLGWAVGLPSDVWALGVLLYKLCYYTTPFEEHGTLAIVNARYTFPQYPVYSPQIQHLIASMLVDHPARRPTVFEVLRTACEMSGTRPEVEYPKVSRSFAAPPKQQSTNLLDFTSPSPTSTPPSRPADIASTVQPGRRGRPTRETSQQGIPTINMPPLPKPPQVQAPLIQTPVKEAMSTGIPKMDGTGHGAAPTVSAKPTGKDAFGVPSVSTGRSGAFSASSGNVAGRGFGVPSVTTGKSDAFGMLAMGNGKESSRQQKIGTDKDAFGMPNMGKEPSLDAFGAPKQATNAKLFDRLAPARPTPSFTDSFTGKTSEGESTILTGVPRTTSPAPQSASPQKEATFETRFPSIEMLDADERKQSTNLISPVQSTDISKPPLLAKASMMGHLTGDLASTHLSAVRADKMPTARSTQVTGTAFKSTATEAPKEVDLMTGDGYQELSTASEEQQGLVQEEESSDEEAPESATATYPQQRPSGLAERRAAFEKEPEVRPPRETSPTKRTSMLAARFERPETRARPVSMYSPKTEEPTSAVSAPAAVETTPIPAQPEMAATGTDKTPKAEAKGARLKPAIAPKPKPSMTTSPVNASSSGKPAITAEKVRPEIKPKPSRHGDMPTIHGYSKSSSGRSFPISRPAEIVNDRPKSPEKKVDLGGSPDKRQSVNSLIARWNAN